MSAYCPRGKKYNEINHLLNLKDFHDNTALDPKSSNNEEECPREIHNYKMNGQ